ncbi:MAG TPA: hypothetical protein ENH28_06110 [Euryarchaeota archaeon]|nr:hypothetical protein BMS3Bbin15_01784 [archaeon BMS3Bbin15]HDL15707.1 hypothetical protein [Euryarchaeota archaeon]
MQQLLVEFKNTSEDAPQVPCSVSEVLNREETLSVPRIVLANNSSEEDQLSGKSEQDLRVPALNMHKKPIPDSSARNNEQVKIPAGLDWIRNYYSYTNFKLCEVGQFIHPVKWVVSLPRLL